MGSFGSLCKFRGSKSCELELPEPGDFQDIYGGIVKERLLGDNLGGGGGGLCIV